MATVSFTEMKHGTQEDYAILQEFEHKFNAKTAHRLFEQLERQGHAVSYTHLRAHET